MPPSRIGAVAVVAVSLLLVGCGSNNTTATSTSPSPTPGASQAPVPTPTQTPRTLTFKLNSCTLVAICGAGGGKPGHGTARVDVKVAGYTLTVTMKGLDPNTHHLINWHFGTCAAPDLSLFDQIDVAKADATGTLTSVTNWPGAYSIPPQGQILTVHGADELKRQTHIACASMPN